MSAINTEDIISLANSKRWELGLNMEDTIIESIYADAGKIAAKTVSADGEKPAFSLDRKIDKVVTSRLWGFPLMFLMLAVVFWITISAANYPSGMLASLLIDTVQPLLKQGAAAINMPS